MNTDGGCCVFTAKGVPDEAKAETKDAAEDDPEEKGDDRMHELEKILIREVSIRGFTTNHIRCRECVI